MQVYSDSDPNRLPQLTHPPNLQRVLDRLAGNIERDNLDVRVRAIADIETEAIAPCHREFLRSLQVRANLVVPILTARGLWGLLVAHHGSIRSWSHYDIEQMKSGAETLATAPSIRES